MDVKVKLLKTIFLFTQKKYDDENIAEIFVKKLKKITKDIYKNVYVKDKDAIYTDPAKLDFKNASHCYICKEEFDQKIYEKKKVFDHNHFAGEYRGAAHDGCNKKCKNQDYFQLYFAIFKDMIHIFL